MRVWVYVALQKRLTALCGLIFRYKIDCVLFLAFYYTRVESSVSCALHCLISLQIIVFLAQIFSRAKTVKMDTRAWRNPYHDYDGNPASTQALFDCQGKVMYKGRILRMCMQLI